MIFLGRPPRHNTSHFLLDNTVTTNNLIYQVVIRCGCKVNAEVGHCSSKLMPSTSKMAQKNN